MLLLKNLALNNDDYIKNDYIKSLEEEHKNNTYKLNSGYIRFQHNAGEDTDLSTSMKINNSNFASSTTKIKKDNNIINYDFSSANKHSS